MEVGGGRAHFDVLDQSRAGQRSRRGRPRSRTPDPAHRVTTYPGVMSTTMCPQTHQASNQKCRNDLDNVQIPRQYPGMPAGRRWGVLPWKPVTFAPVAKKTANWSTRPEQGRPSSFYSRRASIASGLVGGAAGHHEKSNHLARRVHDRVLRSILGFCASWSYGLGRCVMSAACPLVPVLESVSSWHPA